MSCLLISENKTVFAFVFDKYLCSGPGYQNRSSVSFCGWAIIKRLSCGQCFGTGTTTQQQTMSKGRIIFDILRGRGGGAILCLSWPDSLSFSSTRTSGCSMAGPAFFSSSFSTIQFQSQNIFSYISWTEFFFLIFRDRIFPEKNSVYTHLSKCQ